MKAKHTEHMTPGEVSDALENAHVKLLAGQDHEHLGLDHVLAEAHRIVNVVAKLGSILPVLESVYPQIAPVNDVLQGIIATAPKILDDL